MGGKQSGAGERLVDQIALGVLTKVFAPGLVDEVVDVTGRRDCVGSRRGW